MKKLFIIIRDPFKIIKEKKSEFIIWFLFTIIAGQFGVLANIIVRYYTSNTDVTTSIYIESINGSFYTFSIALVASILGPIFINFLNSIRLEFRTLKTFTIIISIFYLFIAGIIYAAIQSKADDHLTNQNFKIDTTQLIIYLFAISFAAYGYCILGMENSSLNFDSLNDPLFSDQDDQNVEEIIEGAHDVNNDQNGIEL